MLIAEPEANNCSGTMKKASLETERGTIKMILLDFALKLLEHFTKNLFCNMKLLFQHREENIKVFLVGRTYHNQLLVTSLDLKYTGRN